MPESHVVALGAGRGVTALHYAAERAAVATLVLAHGAGANQQSDFMTGVAHALAARHLHVVTFNFPYTERGRRLPDPQPVLESCYRSILDWLPTAPGLESLPLFIGGKSMGGRIATHVAAARDADQDGSSTWWSRLRGLVLLGYPLHPPARPQQVRVSHLPRVAHPMLFVQGEKDAFGTPVELQAFLDVLGTPCTLHPVAMGGHSFEVPKRSGIPQAEVDAAIHDTIARWIGDRL